MSMSQSDQLASPISLATPYAEAEKDNRIHYSSQGSIVITNLERLLPQDVEFLTSHGCLHVPTSRILDEFLEQYSHCIHPFMPVVDEMELWRSCKAGVAPAHRTGRLSMLVLKALMAASCPFVSARTLRAIGFATPAAARASLHRQAKLLFDLDTEVSVASRTQAALLLSLDHGIPGADPGRWLTSAVYYVRGREHCVHSDQGQDGGLWQRLWWCCVIRDRAMTLALSGKRQQSIHPSEIPVEDVLSSPSAFNEVVGHVGYPQAYSVQTREALAEASILVVKLLLILGDLPFLTAPLHRHMSDYQNHEVISSCLSVTEASLNIWYSSATSCTSIWQSNMEPACAEATNLPVTTASIMYLYYHWARLVVSSCQIPYAIATARQQNGVQVDPEGPTACKLSWELQNTISDIMRSLETLEQHRFGSFLPNMALGCVALPLVLTDIHIACLEATQRGAYDQGKSLASLRLQKEFLGGILQRPEGLFENNHGLREVYEHIGAIAGMKHDESVERMAACLEFNCDTPTLSYLLLIFLLQWSLANVQLPTHGDLPKAIRELLPESRSPVEVVVHMYQRCFISGQDGFSKKHYGSQTFIADPEQYCQWT
jgi:hypothetical protein